MILREFHPDDILKINPQSSQMLNEAAIDRILNDAVTRGPCWSAEGVGGRIIAIGGFCHIHSGWATAWSILADSIQQEMVPLTRALRALCANADIARLDMHIDFKNEPSVRWASMLGFRMEAVLHSALLDGRNMAVWLYERNDRG